MKIDFVMLEIMVAAGASGGVILAAVRKMDERLQPKRIKEAVRQKTKRANTKQQSATNGNIEQHPPTPANNDQRVRLFALAPRLVALGLPDAKARQMLGQWAKVTRDNVPAIETAVAGAEIKGPADPIGYIRAVLQDRSSINGVKRNATMDAFDDLIADAGGAVAGDPPMRDVTPRGGHLG